MTHKTNTRGQRAKTSKKKNDRKKRGWQDG